MNGNIGNLDRGLRIALGLALLATLSGATGAARWIGLLGIVPLLTGAVALCPLYLMLDVNTHGKAARKAADAAANGGAKPDAHQAASNAASA